MAALVQALPQDIGVPIHEGRLDVTRRPSRKTLFQSLAYAVKSTLHEQIRQRARRLVIACLAFIDTAQEIGRASLADARPLNLMVMESCKLPFWQPTS
ncbi:hypothetical protein [Mesorhizobium sp.]|uniref:hypothetical protein n=1 Tax=Mesorhizobium sp. TaxID=1871066 RepID=UPI0011F4F719|nr:hypothetical protein [Mesorhizobium sp.]TIO07870.1 MAG: hypothetical protein E5X88_15615 [Mesorhizobium sp.]TIO37085.1 MAG: hypothetical protein E5X89_03600 [Mesorhizobium sp.]TIP14247.1 MAG: hypothetical protein E5X73_05005 [Mesorhizobium sp.]